MPTNWCGLRPCAPWKVAGKIFLIQDVHAANDANFANKILKTLEEPSDHVILLLTAG
ncbi:MAG: hypothetical protein R3A10_07050 [Caldilineaceae bacterium]